MFDNQCGFTAEENGLIKFLKEQRIEVSAFFYNSAIPLKELFFFFVIAGNDLDSFCRIPKLTNELQQFHIIQRTEMHTKNLRKVRYAIRNATEGTGILVKIKSETTSNAFTYVAPDNKEFTLYDSCSNDTNKVSAIRFGKAFDGEYIQIKIVGSVTNNIKKQLHNSRLFKPENYVPFYFFESDLDETNCLFPKMMRLMKHIKSHDTA